MRGWALYQRPLNAENRKEALQAFGRAQTIDPHSLDAEIGIAAVLVVNIADGSTDAPKEEEARAAVRSQAVVYMDETGWREDKKRA